MTVPAKYVTLSNGKLISRTKNADGTRTDNWKMDRRMRLIFSSWVWVIMRS